MIVDLTLIFNGIHHLWDIFGAFLGVGLLLGVCGAVLTASVIKVYEHLKKQNK